jgi:hypothetical protein
MTGGMAERPKAAVLKTVGRASAPWVRILLPPPFAPIRTFSLLIQECKGFYYRLVLNAM